MIVISEKDRSVVFGELGKQDQGNIDQLTNIQNFMLPENLSLYSLNKKKYQALLQTEFLTQKQSRLGMELGLFTYDTVSKIRSLFSHKNPDFDQLFSFFSTNKSYISTDETIYTLIKLNQFCETHELKEDKKIRVENLYKDILKKLSEHQGAFTNEQFSRLVSRLKYISQLPSYEQIFYPLLAKSPKGITVEDVSKILNSFSKLLVLPSTAIEPLEYSLQNMEGVMDGESLSYSLTGINKLMRIPPWLEDFLCEQIQQVENLSWMYLSIALHSCTMRNYKHKKLFTALVNKMAEIDTEDLTLGACASIIRYCRIFEFYEGVEPDLTPILGVYDGLKGTHQPTEMEAYVFAKLSNLIPNTFEYNSYIDGIELDVFDREKNINIELDGKDHEDRVKKDALRDEFLQDKYGITVIRIPYEHCNRKYLSDYLGHDYGV